jgi:hypothetical protein
MISIDVFVTSSSPMTRLRPWTPSHALLEWTLHVRHLPCDLIREY